jgi:hypothetical protein
MKHLLLLALFATSFVYSQSPKETIHLFFEALNNKDADRLFELVADDIKLHSLEISKEVKLMASDKTAFLNGIKSIPPEMQIEERIYDVQALENDMIAQVWAPYEFYINGNFSHKGVNAFTLVMYNNNWLITSITDTRNRNKD